MDQPHIADKKPIVRDEAAGTYHWCACGLSQSQPFCDGAHAGSGFKSKVVELTEARKVAWCMCKHSANGAFCDGSHSKL